VFGDEQAAAVATPESLRSRRRFGNERAAGGCESQEACSRGELFGNEQIAWLRGPEASPRSKQSERSVRQRTDRGDCEPQRRGPRGEPQKRAVAVERSATSKPRRVRDPWKRAFGAVSSATSKA